MGKYLVAHETAVVSELQNEDATFFASGNLCIMHGHDAVAVDKDVVLADIKVTLGPADHDDFCIESSHHGCVGDGVDGEFCCPERGARNATHLRRRREQICSFQSEHVALAVCMHHRTNVVAGERSAGLRRPGQHQIIAGAANRADGTRAKGDKVAQVVCSDGPSHHNRATLTRIKREFVSALREEAGGV
jgi:hypothetical protein